MIRLAPLGALLVGLAGCSSSSNNAAGWPSGDTATPSPSDAAATPQDAGGSTDPDSAVAYAAETGSPTPSTDASPVVDSVAPVVDAGAHDAPVQYEAGPLACPSGFTKCGDTCANLTTDPNFCGSCTTACSGGASMCVQGVCESYLSETTWASASSSSNATVSAATSSDDTTETFTYDDNNTDVYSNQTFTFSTVAQSSFTLDFNWTYAGFHAFYEAVAQLVAYADGPGGTTTVTLQPSTSVYGNFTYSGSSSLSVTSGYAFGFIASGSNYDSSDVLRGTVTITQQ